MYLVEWVCMYVCMYVCVCPEWVQIVHNWVVLIVFFYMDVHVYI